MQEQYADRLKSDVVGLLGAATLGVVMLSPAMTLYGGFGPTFLAAGRAAPLAFVWALLATLPTVLSYVLLSREYPLSGSTASWINLAAPHPLAVWAGWIVFRQTSLFNQLRSECLRVTLSRCSAFHQTN
jgi:amino acid transporter